MTRRLRVFRAFTCKYKQKWDGFIVMRRGTNLVQGFVSWWEHRSLQSRLIAAYIAIILVPSLLVSIVSFRAINETYMKDAVDKSAYILDMEKLHIMNQIESMERSAQLAVSDKEVLNYLTRKTEPPLGELVDFNMSAFVNLTRIQFNNPNIEHLHLFTDNPYAYEIWPIIYNERRIKDEIWYKDTYGLGDLQMWSFQHTDRDLIKRTVEQEPKVSLLREISVISGEHSGIIQVDMLLSEFSPRTFTVQDEQSQLFLVDEEGEIFSRAKQSLLSNAPMMEQAIQAKFQALSDGEPWQMEYKEAGKSYIFLSVPLEGLNAHLLNVLSMEDVLAQISKIRNTTIGINILFIVIFTIIAYVLNSFILKNLVRLTDAMKKARRGELYTGVVIRGGGEIGELAFHFNKLMNKINELVAVAVRKEAMSKEAELRTLHNQIDSHFLYNTLENIRMLAEMEDQREIADSLTSLGGMMRYNFKWSGDYVKLRDELRHIRNYIEVMNIRFDTPITLIVDVPNVMLEAEVLKMSLQPIVENSVKHGWYEEAEVTGSKDKTIIIRAEAVRGKCQIWIQDNGTGMAEEELKLLRNQLHSSSCEKVNSGEAPASSAVNEVSRSDRSAGIGLMNVHQRIQLFFGAQYGLMLHSTQGVGTIVTITLPTVVMTGGDEGEETHNRG
ncbi:sensor histidine kinase [Paenibacillus sp. PDC88]|uniref:cache domain-containing sensor histidine kinase n=1 Tax=Paenibacillus sp. PDC88 TaxID=1884375 RepID=UPI0008946A69|nr:sensor histidine kinase [Paenibacillus sp. PDC88]SDX44067.1 two-component system, sensor histidine kinase YesM [Paenibacillus sp. PDC88]